MDSLIRLCTRPMVVSGLVVPIANVPHFLASDVGNELAKGSHPGFPSPAFAGTYFDRHDHVRVFSLRSVGDFDTSEIAARYGGGGRRNAAGFSVPLGWEVTSHEML